MSPAAPDSWTLEELRTDAAAARALFVKQRLADLQAEQQIYRAAHADYAKVVRAFLEATSDLANFTGDALKNREVLNLARQLAVPPISADDLDTLTDGNFGGWLGQTTDRGGRPTDAEFAAAAKIIGERIDADRARWLAEDREPTDEEREIYVEWAAAPPAAGKVMTARRSSASARQEAATRDAAAAAGYTAVTPPSSVENPIDDMEPATFATAPRSLAKASMDVPIRLKAQHPTGLLFLAIECKVSNSALNSRKRLIEVSQKRDKWDRSGRLYQYRTAAVLSGVFDVARVLEAQQDGVFIFWEHRLQDLTDFLSK